jgi:hypothetical protein
MQALLLVAERNGPTMPARIGMMKGAEPARAETGAGTAPETREGLPDRALGRLHHAGRAFFLPIPDCCHQSTVPPLG